MVIEYKKTAIVSICSHMIVLSMIICLGVHGLIGFHKSTTTMKVFKYLFMVSLVLSSMWDILYIATDISYIWKYCFIYCYGETTHIGWLLHLEMYALLLLTLLATLIARLHYTFNQSVYAVSNVKLFCIIILYIFDIIFNILSTSLYATGYYNLGRIVAYVFGILYVILSVYATALFVQALFQLTTSRAISVSNMTKKQSVKLNKQQIVMMSKAARYISLISLALFSTLAINLLSFIFYHLVSLDTEQKFQIALVFYKIFISIDCFINLLCLNLQYQFSKKWYNIYCKCFQNLWKSILIYGAEKSMNRRYTNETNRKIAECKSISLSPDIENAECKSISPSPDIEMNEANKVNDNVCVTPDVPNLDNNAADIHVYTANTLPVQAIQIGADMIKYYAQRNVGEAETKEIVEFIQHQTSTENGKGCDYEHQTNSKFNDQVLVK